MAVMLAVFVEGNVVGPDARPVANALVMARRVGSAETERAQATRTDASGRFRLAIDSAAPHELRVEAPGLAAATVPQVRPGDPARIVLRAGLSLEGVVRDGRSGQPVAGARVLAREEGAGRFASVWEPGAATVETRTDGKGRYRLDGLGRAPYSIGAQSRGGGRALPRSVFAGERADLVLVSGGSLSGVVNGPDGKPVEGVVVRLEPEAVRIGTRERPAAGERTDRSGRFEMAGLEPGLYRLVALEKDYAPAMVSGLAVTPDAAVRTQVTLERGAAVSGRLLAEPDRPLTGRVLVQELLGQAAPAAVAELSRTTIPGDGRFRLPHLPRGSHRLGLTADGYATRPLDVTVGERDLDLGDVVLEAGMTLLGHVRDEAGVPVSHAQLTAFQWAGAAGLLRAESRVDGSFALAGLLPGRYVLTVGAAGFGGRTQDVAAGAEDLEIVLRAAGEVTGMVVDAAGRKVEAFAVALRPTARPVGPPDSQILRDTEGRFRVEGLTEGTYVLRVVASGRGATTMTDVKVAPGRTTDVGRVRLPSTAMIHGVVTDSRGVPIGGAGVSVRSEGTAAFGPALDEAVTDAAGAFELGGVSIGPVEITARHPEYAEETARLTVATEPETEPARITLHRGGRLEGLVRTAAGPPPPMSFLRLEPLGLVGVARPSPEMVSTLRDGSFAFDHVRVGRSRLVLMTGQDGRFTRSEAKEVEIREGSTTTVEIVSP